MKPLKVRNIKIGEGKPKICIPVVAAESAAILEDARRLMSLPVQLVEWRADRFEDVTDTDSVLQVLANLRSILKDIPLLFTFRTHAEGGEKEISSAAYEHLNSAVIKSGLADLVDLEVFSQPDFAPTLIDLSKSHDVKVIASNHDFKKTPAKEDILQRLTGMEKLGADIAKIAVMPSCAKDVLTLLSAAVEAAEGHLTNIPVITVSMAPQGLISRIAGEMFNSAVTFGTSEKSSAPGQIQAEDLNTVLDIIHKNFNGSANPTL